MKTKGLFCLSSALLVLWTLELASGADLRGRFAISGYGGISFATGRGFSHDDQVKEAYGFGLGLEYFFRSKLSGGLEVSHTSFPGKRNTFPDNPFDQCRYYLSTEWNWTKVSLFGRVHLAPEKRFSPFFKAGMGLYLPRIEDWIFCPNREYYYGGPCPFAGIEHTRKTYGKGQFGYCCGFGIQYLIGDRLLFHSEMIFNTVYADGLVIRWLDYPPGIWHSHEVGHNGHYLSTLAGVSFLFGPVK